MINKYCILNQHFKFISHTLNLFTSILNIFHNLKIEKLCRKMKKIKNQKNSYFRGFEEKYPLFLRKSSIIVENLQYRVRWAESEQNISQKGLEISILRKSLEILRKVSWKIHFQLVILCTNFRCGVQQRREGERPESPLENLKNYCRKLV